MSDRPVPPAGSIEARSRDVFIMWLLFLLTVLNAALPNSSFVLAWRIELAGMPLSIFDGLVALGFILAVFRPGSSRYLPTEKTHPALKWIIVLFAVSLVGGTIAALNNGVLFRWMATWMRNWAAMPITIFIAYRLTPRPKSAVWITYAHVIGGLIVAIPILLFFRAQGNEITTYESINKLRMVDYMSWYADLIAPLILVTVLVGVSLFPLPVSILVAGVCLLGALATLSRSDWLAVGAALVGVYFVLPKGARQGLFKSLIFIPVIVAVLWGGIFAASAITGKNFAQKMADRVYSMLPGGEETPGELKAWASRMPGINRELTMYGQNPLIGRGFGSEEMQEVFSGQGTGLSMHHNVWTSSMAQAGTIGLFAMLTVVGSMFVVGRRMVRDRFDRTSVLIGGFSAVAAVYFFVLGMATLSINILRGAIAVGVLCGVVLRCRAMQQTLMHQQAFAGAGDPQDASGELAPWDEPAQQLAPLAHGEYGYDLSAYDS